MQSIQDLDSSQDKVERIRKIIVNLCFAFGILLLTEGALRKWFLAPFQQVLYFIKDPLVILSYLLASIAGLWPKGLFFRLSIGMIALTFVVGLFQVLGGINSIGSMLLGWRNYCFLIPFAFLMQQCLNGKDLFNLSRYALLTSIPMAVLVFIQYRSPRGALVNMMLDEKQAFAYGKLARASGTFSFTAGHEYYCQAMLAFLLVCWILPNNVRPVKNPLLWVVAAATVVNILLNGNRGVFSLCAATWLMSLVYRLLAAPLWSKRLNLKKAFRLIIPEVLIVLAVCSYSYFFADALEAMMNRIIHTERSSVGNAERVYGSLTYVIPALAKIEPLGKGLGLGISAGRRLAAANSQFVFEENDLPRVIAEAGYLGILLILFRFSWGGLIFYGAIKASRRTGNPFPLLIASLPVYASVLSPDQNQLDELPKIRSWNVEA
ncbi:MAG: hypothetical protein K2X27_05020, partial [Candidatus Obscuribacterales bacterium]|nr:hypothetical protein [Candidatus Obscuribacterales bacterium]